MITLKGKIGIAPNKTGSILFRGIKLVTQPGADPSEAVAYPVYNVVTEIATLSLLRGKRHRSKKWKKKLLRSRLRTLFAGEAKRLGIRVMQ